MKTTIYYFTGTGNSLAAARKVAAILGDCGLVPIASHRVIAEKIVPQADRVGIVSPVYDAGLPRIVAEFAERLDLSRAGYTFAIVTMGGTGVSALHQLNKILTKGTGRNLDAAFAVKMPGNFPPVSVPPAGEKKDAILAAADRQLAFIAHTIDQGIAVLPGFSPVSSLMRCLVYPPFFRNVHEADKVFTVSDACTSCGICAKVCPKRNIVMENDRPVWQHNCEWCCACLHFCPVEAIQLNTMQGTRGRGRYRHPDLKVDDMKAQRGEEPETAPS